MSNSNNNISTSFENVFKKHKNIILALPVVLLVLILGLYFTSNDKEVSGVNSGGNIDTSIPSSNSKELSDSKTEVSSDYEIMNDEKNKKTSEQDAVLLDEPNTSTTYEQPDDEVVNKVNKMMAEMDKKNKKRESSNPRPASYSSTPVRNYKTESSNVEVPSKVDNNESLNSFFSSKKEDKSNTSSQSNNILIYAVIKGDQIIKDRDRVTLMLTKNTTIRDKVFLKNTIFFATASFQNDRVNLVIVNINQVQVNLKAYDAEDGGLGLHVSQSLLAESYREVVNDVTDEFDVSGIPLGGTIKKILKRKQQIPKISLLNNQKIIIKDN